MSAQQLTMFKATIGKTTIMHLTLANLEPGQMTLRCKLYAIKYHQFRSHVYNKESSIMIEKISTENQGADILTKGLVHRTFEMI